MDFSVGFEDYIRRDPEIFMDDDWHASVDCIAGYHDISARDLPNLIQCLKIMMHSVTEQAWRRAQTKGNLKLLGDGD